MSTFRNRKLANTGTIEEIVKKISLHTAEISSYKSISYDETEIGIAK